MTEKQYSEKEKLQMLLSHWLQHNESHGTEYAKWIEIARQAGHSSTADYIEQAVELLAKADKAFAKALASVGGAVKGHADGHHHHHHHEE